MIAKLVREPALVLGVLTALFGIATAAGMPLSIELTGAIVAAAGAIMALLRFVLTPSSEVVAQALPSGEVVAGQAAAAPTGSELPVTIPDPGEAPVLLPTTLAE